MHLLKIVLESLATIEVRWTFYTIHTVIVVKSRFYWIIIMYANTIMCQFKPEYTLFVMLAESNNLN